MYAQFSFLFGFLGNYGIIHIFASLYWPRSLVE